MLRALAWSLIGANLLFFAWTQGGLGTLAPVPPGLQGREPERLEQQVRPEALTVLRPRATAAPMAGPGASSPRAPPVSGAPSPASAPLQR